MTGESNNGRDAGQPAGRPQPVDGGLRELLAAAGSQQPTQPVDLPTEVLTPRPAAARRPTRREWNQWLRDPKTRRIALVLGIVFGIALLGYFADLALTSGKVPRAVTVAGVDIGGMDRGAAQELLKTELTQRAEQEVSVTYDDVSATMVPSAAGLTANLDATWERIGGQPLNPITRLTSFFGTRTVDVVSTVDESALRRTLAEFRTHDRPAVEGTIVFDQGQPQPVQPVPGRELDVAAASDMLINRWYMGQPITLPVHAPPLAVQPGSLEEALRDIAEPAVSAPVVFTGPDDAYTELSPAQIAEVLTFAPDGQGGLAPQIDIDKATGFLAPGLADSEVEPRDASFELNGGKPTIIPAVEGNKVDWPKTLATLPDLLVASEPQRQAPAIYAKVNPKLTTQAAEALGIVEPIGSFTTSGFSQASGVNIRTVATEVNGAVVKPGDTFSLNGHTGPRGTAQGYVESGIINHGRPDTAVGGGISQFATTLYNAAYFAGMEDAGHTEHSYYISRYPAAREATVFDGLIDLKFRNSTKTGVYVESFATSSDVTVRLWGTKTVKVDSIAGDRTKETTPETITLPAGDDCIATQGAKGFTTSNTRVITSIDTGKELSRTTRTVKYDPVPVVKCVSEDDEENQSAEESDRQVPQNEGQDSQGTDTEEAPGTTTGN